ncbi:Uma2 family endonuclease [Saccharopolyspora sp. NPDC050389]|uniref:Uma2 family endonuclease n=1 Tax=Saccharopolyspora sp. NPDC050389 TaxID=3155516 RepID=UPI0033EBA19A
MRAAVLPDRLLSLDDWAALPEDDSRSVELVEGTIRVSPRPQLDHQWALGELARQLSAQLPAHLAVLTEVEVAVFEAWPATVRVPDLVVVPVEKVREEPAFYRAADVLLAVEVLAPGSVGVDRVAKFHEYREAGIDGYWIVDLNKPVSIAAYKLLCGYYVPAVTESATTMHFETPVQLTVDPAALLPR